MHRQRFTSSGGVPGDSRRARRLILLCSLLAATLGAAEPARAAVPSPAVSCVAFSPYIAGYNPNTGPHPSAALIEQLLDRLIQQTSTKCIMTYGVLNGLDATFAAARQRGIAVIAIIWLDADSVVNEESVTGGIVAALAYPDTIVRVSCGSEVRTRHGTALDGAIDSCIARLRAAGVPQPITSIDTWWQWCNASWPCQPRPLASSVDWIGINIFPWWENKFSGIFPCTTAADASDFHIARMENVIDRYPSTPVMLTEFGWPSGPQDYSETNQHTGQRCGVAGQANQSQVVRSTLAKLHERQWSGGVFAAFKEPWKAVEGSVGPHWGICDGAPVFRCTLAALLSKIDITVDFGPPFGLWMFVDGAGWRPLHPASAGFLLAADLNGGISRDLIVDFATPDAVWAFMDNSTWQPFHPLHATGAVRTDLDSNGRDDLVVDLGSAFGIWAYMNGSAWQLVHPLSARHIVAADIDGTGRDDLILDFGPSFGIYASRNGAALTPLHGLSASTLLFADLDGDGRRDLIIDFGAPYGVWTLLNDSAWVPLHALSPRSIAAGDLDATGHDDLVLDFGSPRGIWVYRFNTGWALLHGLSATRLVVGDLDGGGKADVVIDFGAGIGHWVWSNGTTWWQLHGQPGRALYADEIVR